MILRSHGIRSIPTSLAGFFHDHIPKLGMIVPKFGTTVAKFASIVLVLVATCTDLVAAPVAVGVHEGIRVVLTDEPCALVAVSNLPRRATWEEGGKTHEGCWGAMQGVVAAYFTDRSVAVMPVELFVRVKAI